MSASTLKLLYAKRVSVGDHQTKARSSTISKLHHVSERALYYCVWCCWYGQRIRQRLCGDDCTEHSILEAVSMSRALQVRRFGSSQTSRMNFLLHTDRLVSSSSELGEQTNPKSMSCSFYYLCLLLKLRISNILWTLELPHHM